MWNLKPCFSVNIRMKLLCSAVLFVSVFHLQAQQGGPVLVNSGAGTLEMSISGSGSPAVVFESGFSDIYEYWDAAVAKISGRTRRCGITVRVLDIPF
jgi:hypothetical protein